MHSQLRGEFTSLRRTRRSRSSLSLGRRLPAYPGGELAGFRERIKQQLTLPRSPRKASSIGVKRRSSTSRMSSYDMLMTFISFTSIAAGHNHLLALTSEGRTFTHPMNKNANSHGQLGLRNFDIPAPPSSTGTTTPSRIPVELIPYSVADPYANVSPFYRSSVPSPASVSENLNVINEQHIGFCDTLFEIPSLKGIRVTQIATGGRSSFVITDSGEVLGWGANEHG
jgi:hypothetical protein